jgi:hypothetical protein
MGEDISKVRAKLEGWHLSWAPELGRQADRSIW